MSESLIFLSESLRSLIFGQKTSISLGKPMSDFPALKKCTGDTVFCILTFWTAQDYFSLLDLVTLENSVQFLKNYNFDSRKTWFVTWIGSKCGIIKNRPVLLRINCFWFKNFILLDAT